MKRLFVTTTNNIDNGKVVEYYGVVASHIVAGTGFFSDFAASFSDFFGGRSGSYRRQLESLYDEALDELSDKAHSLGANGVLGLKIDMDNISGKGMSMFMITAVGTAAKIEFDKKEQEFDIQNSINSDELVNEIAKRAVLKELNNEESRVGSAQWDQILKNPDNDYILPLTRKYFETLIKANGFDYDYLEYFKKNYVQFVSLVDRSVVIQGVYQGIRYDSCYSIAVDIIKKYSLFDAKCILELVKEGFLKRVVTVLGVEQPSYSEADLRDMEALVDAFDNLPDVGRIEMVKGGAFSKDGEKYFCQHGHKNNPHEEFCTSCGENIKGLERNDIEAIETFKNRVAVLKDLLSK